MDLRLPAIAKRFKVPAFERMRLLIFLLLTLSLATAWGQVSAPLPEDSTKVAIEAVLADFDAKKNDEALAKLETLQKKLPDDPLILNLIGSVYSKKKDYLAAESYFRKAVKKSPGFFPALYNIGEILFLEKKYTEAREHFQAMRGSDTRNELLQFKVVLCDLALNDTERAKKVMNAIKYPGDSPAWYYAHAAYENKTGNNKKAREYVAGAKYIFGPKTSLFDETFEAAGISLK
jgi:predicted Zn-dependent protease